MGKDIVIQEGEPGKRSRLWTRDDVNDVLTNNTGTMKIEGIKVQWQREEEEDDEICLNSASFSGMTDLIYFSSSEGVRYSGNIDYLPNKLQWLDWPGCPIQTFPSNFHPRELVSLNIRDSCHITRLWERRKICRKLTYMNLSGCASLIELPDFTEIPNLKELMLVGCESLVGLPDSVGSLHMLETLNADGCSKLVKLPREISLKSVRTISLAYCESLEEFPKIGDMDSLSSLDLSFSGIKELDPSIGNLVGLTRLCLNGCENLTTLPCSIEKLQSLETLDLSECSKLATFPKIIEKMNSLRELDVSWQPNIDRLQNLETLDLNGCSKLATFPKIIGKMDSLRKLDVSRSGIKELDPSIGNLVGLKQLCLYGCENLTTLPCSIDRLQNLETLDLNGCSKLLTFPTNTTSLHDDNGDGSLSLPKLKVFKMQGCNLSDGDFLTTLDCLETLTELDLSSNSFVTLPACISKFVNLEKLDLHCCKRLREIPELPPNLVKVDVSDCKSLEKFWKLSKVLEGKESQGIKWINLWNCNRLCDNLGYNKDKLERILLNNQ
ncbi:hypothetical protein M0R45_018173 [Rubus argutus]|uniref:Leucine-rich repeat domain, L domain-containing protein n=1 Tax=Rubus argutus TaxID=59490 RepID=A0AAW1X2M6_RUBAR